MWFRHDFVWGINNPTGAEPKKRDKGNPGHVPNISKAGNLRETSVFSFFWVTLGSWLEATIPFVYEFL